VNDGINDDWGEGAVEYRMEYISALACCRLEGEERRGKGGERRRREISRGHKVEGTPLSIKQLHVSSWNYERGERLTSEGSLKQLYLSWSWSDSWYTMHLSLCG